MHIEELAGNDDIHTRASAEKFQKNPNLSLYSPYYAEACNELAVPISAL